MDKIRITCAIESFDLGAPGDKQLRYLYQIDSMKLDRVFTFYHYTWESAREGRNTDERKRLATTLRAKRTNLRDHYHNQLGD